MFVKKFFLLLTLIVLGTVIKPHASNASDTDFPGGNSGMSGTGG